MATRGGQPGGHRGRGGQSFGQQVHDDETAFGDSRPRPNTTQRGRGRGSGAPAQDAPLRPTDEARRPHEAQQQERPEKRPRRSPHSTQPPREQPSQKGAQQQQQPHVTPAATAQPPHHEPHPHHHALSPEFKSQQRFADLKVGPLTKQALAEGFRYETMTTIQGLAIPVALEGRNVLAKARTGTGKTLAFLIPCIERLAARRNTDGVGALVISPTRELAQQIADDVDVFLDFHRSLSSVTVYGGTNIRTDQRKLDQRSISIVVATPGRLIDHLENTRDFASKIGLLSMLVLDEADQCLDMGFRPAILKILSFLPRAGTFQTMLFSATVPKELVALAPQILGATFEMVDAVAGTASKAVSSAPSSASGPKKAEGEATVLKADNPFQTVAQVRQEYVVVKDATAQIPALFQILQEEREKLPDSHKIIVFFVTARLTQLFAELFNALGIKTLEIHSRQSQSARQRASDEFHDKSAVTMFSSDVTARGMDYPDVSLVVQVGIPSSTEQYIHRLGRTARAGKSGRGMLILMQDELGFLQHLRNLPVKDASAAMPALQQDVLTRLHRGMSTVSDKTRSQGYAAWLGYYNSSKVPWAKERLVEAANEFAVSGLRFSAPPAIPKQTIGKMGLKGVKGLNIESEQRGQQTTRHADPVAAPSARPMRGGRY